MSLEEKPSWPVLVLDFIDTSIESVGNINNELCLLWHGVMALIWSESVVIYVNYIDGRRWNWLSWQFTDKLDADLWSVDGETDCRDSLLTNLM